MSRAFKVVQVTYQPESWVPDYGDVLRKAGHDIEFVRTDCTTEDEIIAAAHDAHAVIATGMQPMTRRVIEQLQNCRFIITMGIGFDRIDLGAATECGILAANVPDFCLEEVSDHVMGLILACTRAIVKMGHAVKSGSWKREGDPDILRAVLPTVSHLRGQTLGLVGFGRIARALVPKAKGFGMIIVANSPHLDAGVAKSLGVEAVSLDRLLRESDIVSLHVPLTPNTTHLIGLEQLMKMKPSAYLVNTARGGVVDQKALYEALTKGYLAGAALDVVDPEPISVDDPLLKLENVIITPHMAGLSAAAIGMLLSRPGEEIARILKGEWPVGLINPEAKGRYKEKWGGAVL